MSLKAFHIIFIAASIVLAFGFAAWSLAGYFDDGPAGLLILGLGSALTGIGLVIYGKYVLKKLKKISYL